MPDVPVELSHLLLFTPGRHRLRPILIRRVSRPASDDVLHLGMKHSEFMSVMWRVADLVRDTFKRGNYLNVILELTVVLRRLECVLARTKPKVSSPTPLISMPTY